MTMAYPVPPQATSRTIYELSKEAHDGLHFSPRYALDTWRRSAEALIRKSEEHHCAGQVDLAFILMARAAVLLLEKIPQHPEYTQGLTEYQRVQLRKQGEECLTTLATYKSMLYLEPPSHANYPPVYPLDPLPLPPPPTALSGPPPSLPPSLQPGAPGPPVPVHQRFSQPYFHAQGQGQGPSQPYPSEPLINACIHPASTINPTGPNVRQLPSIPAQPDYQPRPLPTTTTTIVPARDLVDEAQERERERAQARRNKEIESRDYEFACQLAEEQEREARGEGSSSRVGQSRSSASASASTSASGSGLGLESAMRGMEVSSRYSGTAGLDVTRMPDPMDYKRRSGVGFTGHLVGPGHRPGSPGMGVVPNGAGTGYLYPDEQSHARHSNHPQTHSHPLVDSQRAQSSHPPPGQPVTYISDDAARSTLARPRRRHLRPLQVPITLIPTFLRIAAGHTQRGIEMCGLLLGVIRPLRAHRHSSSYSHPHSSGQLRRRGSDVSIAQSVLGHQEEEDGELEVRALLIPRQEGTSDTCTMKEEEKVIGVQLERGLIALGWIHTHPTQSCFMSSMDLHTHSAYQQTLPEAIAIVCAPRSDPAFGIFRLTEPAGLMTVLQCKRRQTFHEHPRIAGGLYTDADHGGHVLLNERGRGIEVIDLRR